MMPSGTYLLIDFAAVVIPFLFSFHPRIAFYRKWRFFFPAVILTAVPFLIWDIWFTRNGIWGFNPRYLTGFYLFDLPVEEWLFFLSIPYACVFTYEALGLRFKDKGGRSRLNFTGLMGGVFLVAGIFFIDKAYTLIVFLTTAGLLFLHFLEIKKQYLNRFYYSYLLILLPFLLVNGLLTGSFLEAPVVWYNDSENMGLRLFTIPLEDFSYAFSMLLMNVTIYEALKNRNSEIRNRQVN